MPLWLNPSLLSAQQWLPPSVAEGILAECCRADGLEGDLSKVTHPALPQPLHPCLHCMAMASRAPAP